MEMHNFREYGTTCHLKCAAKGGRSGNKPRGPPGASSINKKKMRRGGKRGECGLDTSLGGRE